MNRLLHQHGFWALVGALLVVLALKGCGVD